MRSRTGLLVWETGSSRSNRSDSPSQVSARGSIRHVILFASDVGEISQSIGVITERSPKYLVIHCQECTILRNDIRVSKGVMNGRVQVPDLADHSAVTLGRRLSLSVRIGQRICGGSATPVVEHSTPTILGHVSYDLRAAIGVTIKMPTRARDLIAQARLHGHIRRQLMKQNCALQIESNHEGLLGIDDLLVVDVPSPRTIRPLQTAKEVHGDVFGIRQQGRTLSRAIGSDASRRP